MQKTMLYLLILLAMHVSGTDTLAGENTAGPSEFLPAVADTGTVPVVKQKAMLGFHVGDPQYISSGGLFFISPSTDLTVKVVTGATGTVKIEYRLDNGAWRPYEPFRISSEGPHLIDYRSVDTGGEGSPRSFSVVVDGTSPQTDAFIDGHRVVPGRPGLTGKKNIVTLETKDEGSGAALVEYRIDQGGWQPYAPFAVPSKGTHTVSYRSIDNVGNREGEKSITITSEKIPVRTSLVVGEPKYAGKELIISDKTPLTLAVESMSGVTSTEYRIDRGDWLKYAPFTVSGEGRHEIAFRSTDDAGVKEPEQTLAVVLDGTPPETSLSAGGRKVEKGESLAVNGGLELSFTAEDALSPVKNTEYRMNGGEWMAAAPFSLNGEGKYEIEFRSTDAVGNVGAPGSITVVVDKTPPVSELVVGQPQRETDGVIRVSTATVFQPRGTDGLSGLAKVEYSIDGREDARDSVPFTIATPGRYRIDYQGLDRAGNREPLKTVLVWVEDLPVGGAGQLPDTAGGERRVFRFEGKQAAVPAPMSVVAPLPPVATGLEDSQSFESRLDASSPADFQGPVRPGEFQGTSVGMQPYAGIQKEGNISLWEYITLGIVNISLIIGVMLL